MGVQVGLSVTHSRRRRAKLSARALVYEERGGHSLSSIESSVKGTVLVRPQLLNETSFPDAGRCVVLRARRQERGQKASLCWCGTQAQGGREG